MSIWRKILKFFSGDKTLKTPYYLYEQVATFANLPTTGNYVGRSAICLDTKKVYIWNGSVWKYSHTELTDLTLDLVKADPAIADALAKKHSRSHVVNSTSDHTSSINSGKMIKADANGLPAEATNTDTEVADAVTKKHSPHSDDQDLSGKVDKVTGSSLVPDTEIAKIHTQNTDLYLNTQITHKLYVDGNRTDSYVEDGSFTKPYKKIQDAIDSVTTATVYNRFTIQIMPGEYLEQIVMKNYVHLVALVPDSVWITSSDGDVVTTAVTANLTNLMLIYNGIDSSKMPLKCNNGCVLVIREVTAFGNFAGIEVNNGAIVVLYGGGTLTGEADSFIVKNGAYTAFYGTVLSGWGEPYYDLTIEAGGYVDVMTVQLYNERINNLGTLNLVTPASRIKNDSTVTGVTVKNALETLDTNKTTLSAVKADVDIASAISLKHASHSDDQVASSVPNDSSVIGSSVKDALETLNVGLNGVYDEGIADGNDDCFVFIQDSAINLSDVILMGNNDGGSDNAGFRWLNVNIPKGAIITSAHIVLTASEDTAGVPTSLNIKGEASDNPVTFSTYEDFIARPLGVATVPYVVPPFTGEEVYNTPEIKTIIQEIIDRTGWAKGNAIALFLNDNGSGSFCVRNLINFEYSSVDSARLHIEYMVTLKNEIDDLILDKHAPHSDDQTASEITTDQSGQTVQDALDSKLKANMDSYPEKTTVANDDLLLIADSEAFDNPIKKTKKVNFSPSVDNFTIVKDENQVLKIADRIELNIFLLAYRLSLDIGTSKFLMVNAVNNEFIDQTGIDLGNSSHQVYSGVDDSYTNQVDFAGIDTYTKLMLHLDNDIIDSEITPKSVSRYNVSFPTLINFDYYGVFDGGSYLTTPSGADFNFADGAFTIDGWYNFDTPVASAHTLYCNQAGSNRMRWDYYGGGSLNFQTEGAVPRIQFSCNYSFTLGTWYHIALVRVDNSNSASGWRIFINGVSQTLTLNDGAWNVTLPDLAGTAWIGLLGSYEYPFHGQMDEVRVSKGIARWTTNFTPPTAEYSTDAYTSLLLHLNNNIIDSEGTPKTITNHGVTFQPSVINNSFSYYGIFDGSTSYLTVPESSDFDFEDGDFTIDFWLYQSIANYNTAIIEKFDASRNGWQIVINNVTGAMGIYADDGTVNFLGATPVPVGAWCHYAIVKFGNIYTIYLNGIADGSQTVSYTMGVASTPLRIGSDVRSGGGQWFAGRLDEVRVSKGIARWTTNFTPQIIEYSQVGTIYDMTLQSIVYPTPDVPTYTRLVLFVEDIDVLTLNTDLIAFMSRDGGTTWSQTVLVDENYYETNKKIVSCVPLDISSQPSGTNMVWKIQTANLKRAKLLGVGFSWK